MEELERLLSIEKGIKLNSKAKIIKDETFIDSFLELLFSGEEKNMLCDCLSSNYGLTVSGDEEIKN